MPSSIVGMRARFSVVSFSLFVLATVLFPFVADASTTLCEGEVQSVLLYARSQSEGNVVLKMKLDDGSVYSWTLCNLNEDQIVNGAATSKTGQELIAAQESYSLTCQAMLNTSHIAKATGKKLRLAFMSSAFPTCADVPVWGGNWPVSGEDDPNERLGAWDALFYVELTRLDI